MLRVRDRQYPGWKGLPYTPDVFELLQISNTEVGLQNLTFYPNQLIIKYNQNFTRAYLFYVTTMKEQGQEDLVWEETEYAVFVNEGKNLVFQNEDEVYVHGCKTENCKSAKFAKVFGDKNWKQFDRGSLQIGTKPIAHIRITTFTLHALETTESVQIVQGVRKRKTVNAYQPPECVNACYTTGIMGEIPGLNMLQCLDQSNERSGFGSDFTTSTIFGVMEVFPNCDSTRRVICKAYTNVERANHDVCFLCNILQTTQTEMIKMHMSVWKATTGHQMDISKEGFFHAWIHREFRDHRGPFFKYRGQTDELDVHCVVEVQNFLDVARVIMLPSCEENDDFESSLGALGLYLSCTCMGVCIYRVARHNREFEFCTRLQEEWISRTLTHLHKCLTQYRTIHTAKQS